jgi:L-ribulokinase
LIEGTAFGTRVIIEAFEKNGVTVDELVACGGLPEKNPLLMQIYSDVTGREIKVTASQQAPALGSAMFGAVAAGRSVGGYESIFEAAGRMARLRRKSYRPVPANQAVYEKLYGEYVRLYDYFGRGQNDVMKALKSLRQVARAE